MALPHDAMGLSAVYGCDISRSYSLTFLAKFYGANAPERARGVKCIKYLKHLNCYTENRCKIASPSL